MLQTTLVRGLARVGQDVVLGAARGSLRPPDALSLRYFSQQKAGWIIARLTSDVDALSDVLSQGLTTLVVNTLTLSPRSSASSSSTGGSGSSRS